MSSPRRRLSAEDRRAQLLAAALSEFAGRGYHLTQMDHVATSAGVSKALLYQHFPSKEALFAAVTAEVVDTYLSRLPEVVEQAEEPLVAWRAAVRLLVDLVGTQPETWRLVARYLADPELGNELREMRAGLYDGLAVLLSGFYEGPETGPGSAGERAEQTVPLLVGALSGLLSWWLEHPDVPAAVIEQRAVEFGWLGLDRIRHGEVLTDESVSA